MGVEWFLIRSAWTLISPTIFQISGCWRVDLCLEGGDNYIYHLTKLSASAQGWETRRDQKGIHYPKKKNSQRISSRNFKFRWNELFMGKWRLKAFLCWRDRQIQRLPKTQSTQRGKGLRVSDKRLHLPSLRVKTTVFFLWICVKINKFKITKFNSNHNFSFSER